MLSAGENSEGNGWYCKQNVVYVPPKKEKKNVAHKNKEKKNIL